MKKGFTLVELLGVIIVLSLIAVVTYAGITTMNRKTKMKEFEDYKETLYMAAETYMNLTNMDKNVENYIGVSTLLNESLINKIVENPNTNKEEYNAQIKVKKDASGVLVFEYIGE